MEAATQKRARLRNSVLGLAFWVWSSRSTMPGQATRPWRHGAMQPEQLTPFERRRAASLAPPDHRHSRSDATAGAEHRSGASATCEDSYKVTYCERLATPGFNSNFYTNKVTYCPFEEELYETEPLLKGTRTAPEPWMSKNVSMILYTSSNQPSIWYFSGFLCPKSCHFTAAQTVQVEKDLKIMIPGTTGSGLLADNSLEDVSVCSFLARNGFCQGSGPSLLQASLAYVGGVSTHEFGIGTTSIMASSWTESDVRENCAYSCGLCQAADATPPNMTVPPSSYGQNGESWCPSTAPTTVVPGINQSAAYHGAIACMLYAPSCCGYDNQNALCQGAWGIELSQLFGSTNAFFDPTCGNINAIDAWQYMLAFTGIFAVAISLPFIVLRCRWIYVRRRMRVVPAQVKSFAAAKAEASLAVSTPVRGAARASTAEADHVQVADVLGDRPYQLLGVNVRRLAAALETADTEGTKLVMSELWEGSRFLQRATNVHGEPLGKLAIISYRCVGSESDSFTLDAAALRSVVQAAQQSDVQYLWLDAWAYRKKPPWAPYKHDDFVRTLLAVMLTVSHVIWLPRSRTDAKGEYQYRIWCSFEAMIVNLRRLPVTVAGHPLNSLQIKLVTWGSFLTYWPWAGGFRDVTDIQLLGKVNLAFYMNIVCSCNLVTSAIVNTWYASDVVTWIDEVGTPVLLLCLIIVLWLEVRRFMGQAVMFAKNGNRVLRMMTAAAAEPPRSEFDLDIDRPHVDFGDISKTLPWLAAYDRRDTMTIKLVLDDIRIAIQDDDDGLAGVLKTPSTYATALSSFLFARTIPSGGDSPNGESVRSWLAVIGVTLTDGAQRSLLDTLTESCLRRTRRETSRGARSTQRSTSQTEAPARFRTWLDTQLHLGRDDPSLTHSHSAVTCLNEASYNYNATPSRSASVPRWSAEASAASYKSSAVSTPAMSKAVAANKSISRVRFALDPLAAEASSSCASHVTAPDTPPSHDGAREGAGEGASWWPGWLSMGTASSASDASDGARRQSELGDGSASDPSALGADVPAAVGIRTRVANVLRGPSADRSRLSGPAGAKVDLRGSDLQRCGWRLVRGRGDFVQTPVGRIALEPVYANGEGEAAIRINMDVLLATADLRRWSIVTFYTWTSLSIANTIEMAFQHFSPVASTFCNYDFFCVNHVSINIFKTVHDLIFSVLLVGLLVQKGRNDWINRATHFPIPLRAAGKLEYALAWAAFGTLHAYSICNQLDLSKRVAFLHWNGKLNDAEAKATYVNMWLEYFVDIAYLTSSLAVMVYELGSALVHALTAASRMRDARYLLEWTERKVEGERLVA